MPKRVLQGTVVSDVNEKTVVVRVDRAFTHPVMKRTVRRTGAAVRTTTAFMTWPFLTRPRGIASFTDTTMISPTEAYLRCEPPSTLMHMTRRAPELSATSRLDCIWIMA